MAHNDALTGMMNRRAFMERLEQETIRGEEFVAYLPGVDETSAEKAAERLRKRVAEMDIQTPQGSIHITVSFGTSTCHHSPPETMESPIRRADEAL